MEIDATGYKWTLSERVENLCFFSHLVVLNYQIFSSF